MALLTKIRRDRIGLLLLALVFLVGVTLISLLPSLRLDLTQNRLYTLSAGTEKILGNLAEPLNLYLFFSVEATAGVPPLRTYGARVEEMLAEFSRHSQGKLKVTVIDPLPFSEQEDRATGFGLSPINLGNGGEPIYFGIGGTNGVGDEQILPFLDPSKEAFLEYDLAKLVYTLAHPTKQVVGLLSSLPLTRGFDPLTQQVQAPWVIGEQLGQLFDLRILSPQVTGFDPDLQVLMLVHPKNLSEETLYAIDQFILRGGRTLIFVDPWADMDGGDPLDKGSTLEPLFSAWGLGFDRTGLVGDNVNALRVSGVNGQPVRHLGILGVGSEGLAKGDVITRGLNTVNLAFTGHLTARRGGATRLTPLLWSSLEAALIPVERLVAGSDPATLRAGFAPTGVAYTLAARVRGKLPSAFPARGGGGHLPTAQGAVNLVVVADTDLLADRLWVQTQNLLAQRLSTPFANNGDLVVNALDNLLGSGDLIGMGSRATFQRPFTRVETLRRGAETRFLAAEEGLKNALATTDNRLRQLQAERQDGGGALLSPSQRAEVQRFAARRLQLRRELRQVQRRLDQDIQRLGTWVKVLNVALVPLIISLLSLLLWTLERRGQRRRTG